MVTDRLRWIGPSEPSEVQRDFDAIFCRKLMVDGDIYLQAPPHKVLAVYKQGLEKQKEYIDASHISVYGKGILQSILSPGHLTRLREYTNIYEEKRSKADDCQSRTAYLCDCDHWPNTPGDTSGSLFPVQLKHGCVYSHSKRRLALASEHLAAQGWHVLDIHPDSRFCSPLLPMFEELGERKVKLLSGNGMSLPCIAAWFLYCLSNTVRVESSKLLEEHRVAACNDDGELLAEEDNDFVSEKDDPSDKI